MRQKLVTLRTTDAEGVDIHTSKMKTFTSFSEASEESRMRMKCWFRVEDGKTLLS